MKKLLIVTLLICGTANASLNDLLQLDFSSSLDISGVPVATTACYNGTKLALTGTGTAFKKYGVGKVRIFMMQYFTQNPRKFVRDYNGALDSIKNVGATAINITFMRNVDSATIGETLSSYIVNNIGEADMPRYASDVHEITKAITSDEAFVAGDSISIYAYNNLVIYENVSKKIHIVNSKNNDLTTKLFSMFLGITNDSEGYSLKLQLLQDPKDVFGSDVLKGF